MEFIFVQIVGFIALSFIVISFQKNRRSFTLVSQLVGSLLFTVHYFLLGAWVGAAMNGLAIARAYIFNLRDSKTWIKSRVVMYIFILFFWIGGILTWDGYLSILPILGMSLECVALWSKNTKHMRWIFLAVRPLWMTYNIMVGSYAGIMADIFLTTSLLIAVYRFDIIKKPLNTKKTNDHKK